MSQDFLIVILLSALFLGGLAEMPDKAGLEQFKQMAKEASMGMLDIEFQMEVMNRGKESVKDVPLDNLQIIPTGFNTADEQRANAIKAITNNGGAGVFTALTAGSPSWKDFDIPAGSISIIGASNATPTIWAHEFRHKQMPQMDESVNRLVDAYTAGNKREWDEALDMMQDREPSTTEESLSKLLLKVEPMLRSLFGEPAWKRVKKKED